MANGEAFVEEVGAAKSEIVASSLPTVKVPAMLVETKTKTIETTTETMAEKEKTEKLKLELKLNGPKRPLWCPRQSPGRGGIIQEGDLVILYENHKNVTYIYARASEIFDNRLGAFHHDDIIGQPFGSKIYARVSKRYMYVLAPTPELWNEALYNRTQIVFTLDASVILFHLNVKSGSNVIETGTGSGALSTQFARCIAPHGHLYTFEFNERRAVMAQEEFQRNGIADLVTCKWQDACKQGFDDALAGKMDAVFLDLPAPWLAVGHAAKALKANGRFCSYSPCIEQVQKTCDALREHGFEMLRTIETRLLPMEVRAIPTTEAMFGEPLTMPELANTSLAASTEEENEDEDEKTKKMKMSVADNKKRKSNHSQDNCIAVSDVAAKPTQLVTRIESEIRGHTAFLTFASKFV